MKIGIIGLGKMGSAIAYRLSRAGHTVYGYDPNISAQQEFALIGGKVIASVVELTAHVHIFWIMIPAGKPVDDVIKELEQGLRKSDIVIDGGNSNFNDSIRRAEHLARKNIFFLDCGTSGGLAGKNLGFSLTIGGSQYAFMQVEEIFSVIAAPHAYAHVGPSGAGHYVKMIHNGIEYALLESYAEGFNLLKNGHYKNLNLAQITDVWNKAAIIRSYILELSHEIFKHDHEFKNISGQVGQTGMGKWTVEEAHQQKIPVPVIEDALKIRDQSQTTGGNYATKIVSLLRNAFGGHEVKKNN